jgi:hypothetical protein
MALLQLQEAANGLANVAFSPASGGGDSIPVGARVGGWDLMIALVVKNTDAAAKTVTVAGTPYVVPATTGLAVIPCQQPGGVGYGVTTRAISYSAATNLSVAAVRLSPPP